MSHSSPSKKPSTKPSLTPRHVTPTKPSHPKPSIPDEILRMREDAAFNAALKPIYEKSKVRNITYKHVNSKQSMLTFVPRITKMAGFLRQSSAVGGLCDQIDFMSNNQKHPSTKEPVVVEALLQTILKKYPKSFNSFVNSNMKTTPPTRLDLNSSLALMKDCNLTQNQMRKMNQHTHHHTNYRLFTPEYKLTQHSNEAPTPKITVVKVDVPKKQKEKEECGIESVKVKKEDVQLMKHDVGTILEAHILRYLNNKSNIDLPLDYNISQALGVGVLQLVGTDHGWTVVNAKLCTIPQMIKKESDILFLR